MIIYNVTVKVDATIAAQWLQWMLEEHAPAIIATDCFTKYHVIKLLEVDEAEGPTYAIQYHANSMEDYQRYLDEFADDFRKQSTNKWGDRFIAFRTLMQVVK
jgi:hypothetical protein